jgi:hypothetical protein
MVSVAKATKVAGVCLASEKINPVADPVAQRRVTISGPTVDWMRAEVGDWLSRHPGEKRRAIRGVMSRPEYRRMAHVFYGER